MIVVYNCMRPLPAVSYLCDKAINVIVLLFIAQLAELFV